MRPLLLSSTLLVTAAPAAAQFSTFAEDFDDGSNVGAWSWGTGNETISPLNGNPGPFLQDLTLASCCPAAGTAFGASSIFTGDYAAKGVTEVGVDLITLDADFGVSGRPLTLILWNDAGTPGPFDDWGAYLVGDKDIPDPGVPILTDTPPGWTEFDFQVESQAADVPAGWVFFGPPDKGWSDLMADVDVVQFYYGVPGDIFIFMSWDVGMDDPRITFADCDGNGVPDSDDLAAGALDLDGDGQLDACQQLSADVASVSAGGGGTQNLALHAGPDHAGELYLLLGSLSGTTPGLDLGAEHLPLNADAYLLHTASHANSYPLSASFATLDAAGAAAASFSIAAGSTSLAGLTAHHAYVTLEPAGFAVTAASNAIPVALVP